MSLGNYEFSNNFTLFFRETTKFLSEACFLRLSISSISTTNSKIIKQVALAGPLVKHRHQRDIRKQVRITHNKKPQFKNWSDLLLGNIAI